MATRNNIFTWKSFHCFRLLLENRLLKQNINILLIENY
jgi:hypothetical protein